MTRICLFLTCGQNSTADDIKIIVEDTSVFRFRDNGWKKITKSLAQYHANVWSGDLIDSQDYQEFSSWVQACSVYPQLNLIQSDWTIESIEKKKTKFFLPGDIFQFKNVPSLSQTWVSVGEQPYLLIDPMILPSPGDKVEILASEKSYKGSTKLVKLKLLPSNEMAFCHYSTLKRTTKKN
jgi:hypothetical protein